MKLLLLTLGFFAGFAIAVIWNLRKQNKKHNDKEFH